MRLTATGCRERQQRLCEVLREKELDAALISRRDHVYYFTGFQHNRFNAAAALIAADGRTTLVGTGIGEGYGVDEYVDDVDEYTGDFMATMHSRHFEEVAEHLGKHLPQSQRLGADLGGGISCVAALAGPDVSDVTRDVYRLRKKKQQDELAALKDAITITEVMYDTAKEVVKPGAEEVEVLSHLRAAITRAAGEDLEFIGNDFRANDLGGLARRRRMGAGELYILDAGCCLHGYYADNCRTIAVDRSPSEEQMKVWERIDGVFPVVEAAVSPGVKAVDVFAIADQQFSGDGFEGMIHHLGHGVGMAPHETPELNPHYEAVFEVGDVFTMEPGLYAPQLKAGIRLEENYHLTADGLQKLTSYPRDLV